MKQKDYLLLLAETLKQLDDALHWLDRSYRQCARIGRKANYSPEEFDRFEALTSRFARVSDILVQKVYRSIDMVEFETGGSMLDMLHRAEKRGLIDTVDEIRTIRDLRNSIAHEYIQDSLVEIFQETLRLTPTLMRLVERARRYCQKFEIPD
ncbi:MAG: hypothetical protein D6784_10605 [Chloroflexi bacterium]|nr:MAG: hypothetical protein D6784_10605 [Chloroflexota bacterium]